MFDQKYFSNWGVMMRNLVGAHAYEMGLERPTMNIPKQIQLAQRNGRPDVRSGRLVALLKLETRRKDGHVARRPALLPL